MIQERKKSIIEENYRTLQILIEIDKHNKMWFDDKWKKEKDV